MVNIKFEGKIIKYFEKKGYGFISSKDNTNIFFHISNVINPKDTITFVNVKFDLIETDKGYEAKQIELIHEQIPVFISFGNTRVKLNNIKNYGLHYNSYTEKKPIDKTKFEKTIDSISLTAGLLGSLVNENLYFGVTEQKYDFSIIKKDVLYITTYQNDNFKFEDGECGFDIRLKLAELDKYFQT